MDRAGPERSRSGSVLSMAAQKFAAASVALVLYVVGQLASTTRGSVKRTADARRSRTSAETTVRRVEVRPTRVEQQRLRTAAQSDLAAANRRLDVASRKRKPQSLMSEQERADLRLAKADVARLADEPKTSLEIASARLEAAAHRPPPRALMTEAQLIQIRLQDAARQRRRRANLSDQQRVEVRLAEAARKRAMRASSEYASLSPEARWREKGRHGLPPGERPFVGVDGEAGYCHDPWCTLVERGWCECRQYYAALTAGDLTLANLDGRPLTTWQCLEFLSSLPKDARYVGYFFDFDVTHILLGLGSRALEFILHPERNPWDPRDKCVPVTDPVKRVKYRIRYVPHKYLKIRRPGHHDITIYDCAGYWQTSFYKAIGGWQIGTVDELATIKAGKESRDEFTLPLAQDVLDYNVLECKLLAELMTKLDWTARDLGIRMRAYHGAGTLAEALLDQHATSEYSGAPDSRSPELEYAINCAFFGGRFENAVVGVVEALHVWDIASAYPAAMVTLPCLRHGEWRHHKRVRRLGTLSNATMVYVRWDAWPSQLRPFGPLPYRCQDGDLIYPLSGEGWYWIEEVRAAINYRGVDSFEIVDAWEWVQRCEHRPFDWIPELYEQRQRLGKNTAGMVLKYGMNSLYGKMAQTIGGGGRYTEFVWAGMTTARTRAKLLDIAALAGPDAVMFATDGVGLLRIPPELERVRTYPSEVPLGEWEYAPVSGGLRPKVLMVQNGFYIESQPSVDSVGPSDARPRDRARGIGVRVLDATNGRDRLYAAFRSHGADAVVPFGPEYVAPGQKVPKLFIGLKSAFHRRQMDLAGRWVPVQKTVRFAPEPRRDRVAAGVTTGETFIRTTPPMNGSAPSSLGITPKVRIPSAPYRKLARKQEDKDLYWDQPDHVDGLANLLGEE